jgi:FlaG/FlaF family flagellin (archaellin)
MKKLILIAIVVILSAATYAFYLFNKKTPGLENVKSDFKLTSNELFDSFEKDESTAMSKFENKVIEVTGTVFAVQKTDSLSSVTLVADNAMIGGVNCSFNNNKFEANVGQIVTIKGRCQGYLTDVILNNSTQVK